MKKLTFLLALVIVGVVALAGCGGGSKGGEVVDLGTIELQDYKFVPSQLDLKAGTTYKVLLKNTGTQIHDFSIEGTNISKTVQAGQQVEFQFKLDRPGQYTVVCVQPGHNDLGMHFTTQVK